MKLIGIALRKPSFGELTAAAVMATGVWLATLGAMSAFKVEVAKGDAGALLLIVAWACVSARLGIRIGLGHRHLLANMLGSALLLALYEVARRVVGA